MNRDLSPSQAIGTHLEEVEEVKSPPKEKPKIAPTVQQQIDQRHREYSKSKIAPVVLNTSFKRAEPGSRNKFFVQRYQTQQQQEQPKKRIHSKSPNSPTVYDTKSSSVHKFDKKFKLKILRDNLATVSSGVPNA
mmetsp:Transcript_18720/g.28709  ORF Transcript_18720/g.28709 Transcript_18720/m.28709 type:complete len:134 (-) Transcript_18720:1370-1771(-)